uniref:RCC1-like domain-containing protein n=1 Tax=Mucochytrium quahogii TaxID=96639 RepID=A0A7S2RKT9_9STRA|mmetsp:Transcript_20441/g.33736  ORF Transcript_20441/g.33736 Transcript_20441/m.33736 type:complete len:1063 (-) Transcript_20441:80-3268(-)|eukprot:CAMPEP_0203747890 /NCGR_PEP_ID=MMETSP0098-20131031/2913_1 /ASSEMBLY_ACC=CAM_ASM_000208 /TAXON_ID=96639 /ORGANISM=" , Strain NY0313808BC1" /LENGTH=1062 /DNA_ID=CAMNT_0050636463 /DNA_START=1331 /DNA_END=4519 /DNA_ORIENTATION=-
MSLVTFGWNQNSQLGHGDSEIRVSPCSVDTLESSPILQIVCGSRYTVALSRQGNVFSWGRGDDFQLGHIKGTSLSSVPRMIKSLEQVKVVAIAARGAHTLALTGDGKVFSWGRNDEGQLGLGTRDPCRTPTEIAWFRDNGVCVKKIACGRVHSAAISLGGDLYTWGCNDEGSTGHQTSESQVVPGEVLGLAKVEQVACGSRHTLVLVCRERQMSWVDPSILNTENALYAFGWGMYGQLGVGDRRNRSAPSQVVFSRDALPTTDKVRISSIACGYRHSLAILSPCQGQSDTFTDDDDEIPFNTLWAWGWNRYGQLGLSEKLASSCCETPMLVSLPHSAVTVAGGGRHTVAVLQRSSDSAKRMYSWGRNDDGQCGIGFASPEQREPIRVRSSGDDVQAVAAGWSHSAALLEIPLEAFDETLNRDLENVPGGMGRSPSTPFFSAIRRPSELAPTSTFRKVYLRASSRLSEIMTYGNLDAGFAQFLNTLILLLNILASLRMRVGLPQNTVIGLVVPGACLTVFVSNIVFGVWADMKSSPATTFTALPHGINTVIFFAYTMLIMTPVYEKTGDAQLAYRTGLVSCFLLGVLELPCLFLVTMMRKLIPRAAMMSAMAGVSITFIAMTFTVQIFSNPAVGIIPLVVVLVCYGSNVQLPYKIPAGLMALMLGALIIWGAKMLDIDLMVGTVAPPSAVDLNASGKKFLFLPTTSLPEVIQGLLDPRTWSYITVVIPMLIVNMVTNLSCIEGSAVHGEAYDTKKALAMDALITIFGSLVGNPYPTCIYIGHGAFKSMGATSGYSYISAVSVLLLGITNGASGVMQFVPEVAGVGILMWIGIVVTAQAFDRDDDYTEEASSSKSHAAAVALGLLPALAAWCLQYLQATIPACSAVISNSTVSPHHIPFDQVMKRLEANGIFVFGLISLSRGYLLSSIFLSSMLVEIVDRQFKNAAMWMLLAASLSFVGAVHSFELDGQGINSNYGFPSRTLGEFPLKYCFAYLGSAFVLILFEIRENDTSIKRMLQRCKKRISRTFQDSDLKKTRYRPSRSIDREDFDERKPLRSDRGPSYAT